MVSNSCLVEEVGHSCSDEAVHNWEYSASDTRNSASRDLHTKPEGVDSAHTQLDFEVEPDHRGSTPETDHKSNSVAVDPYTELKLEEVKS